MYVEYIIVISHAGLEDFEIPLPEIRNMYKSFIDMGADLVIAHHPHIIQGMEVYKGKRIFYSLGNFMFDSLCGKGEYKGNSIGITVSIVNGQLSCEVIPFSYADGYVSISSASQIEFRKANQLLENEDLYYKRINDKCICLYQSVYSRYYCQIAGGGGVFSHAKSIIKQLLGQKTFDERMVYHNISIETHRWIVIRALELLMMEHKI